MLSQRVIKQLLGRPCYRFHKIATLGARDFSSADSDISTRSLFRKLFSFYTLAISYIPKQGHHGMVISSKSLFRITSNSNTLKTSANLCLWISRGRKKNLKTGVLSALTKHLS